MTNQHPITPPPELVQQWKAAASNVPATLSTDPGGRRDYIDFIATRAAQWGADQELEACCEWFVCDWTDIETADKLRTARRPKPPSLAEEALIGLEMIDECAIDQMRNYVGFDELLTHKDTIRRALEQLKELEGAE